MKGDVLPKEEKTEGKQAERDEKNTVSVTETVEYRTALAKVQQILNERYENVKKAYDSCATIQARYDLKICLEELTVIYNMIFGGNQ